MERVQRAATIRLMASSSSSPLPHDENEDEQLLHSDRAPSRKLDEAVFFEQSKDEEKRPQSKSAGKRPRPLHFHACVSGEWSHVFTDGQLTFSLKLVDVGPRTTGNPLAPLYDQRVEAKWKAEVQDVRWQGTPLTEKDLALCGYTGNEVCKAFSMTTTTNRSLRFGVHAHILDSCRCLSHDACSHA